MPVALTITTQGAAALAQAAISGTGVAVRQIALGNGTDPHGAASTELHNLLRLFSIEELEVEGNTVTFRAVVPASWGGYHLREIGLITNAGILLAVGSLDFYKPAGASGFDLTVAASLHLADIAVINTDTSALVAGANQALVDVEAKRLEVEAMHTDVLEAHTEISDWHEDIETRHEQIEIARAEVQANRDDTALDRSATEAAKDTALGLANAAAASAAVAQSVEFNNLRYAHNIQPRTLADRVTLLPDDTMLRFDALIVTGSLTLQPGAAARIL